MAQWDVSVIWPGEERARESKVEHTDVQITDGGVLRMYRDGAVVAVYGPGFWVGASPRAGA